MNLLFEILRYITLVYTTLLVWWNVSDSTTVRRYFLSDDDEYDELYSRVPENAVYIEEWTDDAGKKLCYVAYEGEEIRTHTSPFPSRAYCPWAWIGDEETEIDMTRTFAKFLVPGNVIRLDLVEKLIHITESTRLMYLDVKTFEPKEFPGDGILIEENV